jgi:hypothetical protein
MSGIDMARILERLVQNKYTKYNKYRKLIPIGNPSLVSWNPYEIVEIYSQKFISLGNYYRQVRYPSRLNYISYLYKYSCAKTIARRLKLPVSQVFKRYGKTLCIPSPDGKRTCEFLPYLKPPSTCKEHKVPSAWNEDPFKINRYERAKYKAYSTAAGPQNQFTSTKQRASGRIKDRLNQ